MKTNYHTHTKRCHHASGSDEEYVLSAIKGGYDVLGFSDHSPWKYDSDFVGRIRMPLSQFEEYHQSVLQLKEKYKDQIDIKIGLECEYFPKYMDWLKNFKEEMKLDYIILGNHFDQSDEIGVYYGTNCNDDQVFIRYIDDCIEGLKTGVYAYLAHPDLFMRGRTHFDALAKEQSYRLCKACKEMGVVLEYNLEGMRATHLKLRKQYPHPDFWNIASEVGNVAIIGVDAHHPKSLQSDKYYQQAINELKHLNIERLETIEECIKQQKNAKSIDFKRL